MFFQGGLATAHPAHHGRAPASGAHTESGLLADRLTTTLHRAAAAQATHFGAEALPYIRVYDAHGKFVASVTGGMWDEVLAAIEKAGR